jgi:drug/metabolite transporter (DMT)-like permease
MSYILFLLICTIWGSNFMLMKQAALGFSGVEIAFGRVIGGMLVLGLFWWLQGARWKIRRTDWGPLALVIAIGYAWPYTLQPILVAKHGGALIGMSISFVPLVTVVLSVPFLGVYPSRRALIGVLGALIFLIGMLVDSHQRSIPLLDLALASTVPIGYAFANICIRRRLLHISSLDLSFLALVWTAVCLIPALCYDLSPAPPAGSGMLWPLMAIVLLGLVGTGMANWMFNRLIHQEGPLFAGMVTNLVPLGAVIWGWADSEHVSTLQWICLLGTMLMVGLVQYGSAKSVK